MATVVAYTVVDALPTCVETYKVIAQVLKVRAYCAPFLPDDHRGSPVGSLGVGPGMECPWCYHTAAPTEFQTWASVEQTQQKASAALWQRSCVTSATLDVSPVPGEHSRGCIQDIACHILMTDRRATRR